MSFYNTISLSGEELKKAQAQCNAQEQLVLRAMEQQRNEERRKAEDLENFQDPGMTPCEVWQKVGTFASLLPSIRRAMTDLTKDGLLVKTDEKKKGLYGKANYIWKLNY